MRKHGSTPCRQDKYVTLAVISPPGVARGRFVGGDKSGLVVCKLPPLFKRGASDCSSQRQRQHTHGAPPHNEVHLPTYLLVHSTVFGKTQCQSTPCRQDVYQWTAGVMKEGNSHCGPVVSNEIKFAWDRNRLLD